MQGRDGAGSAERYARELRGYSEQILREWQGTSTWKPGEQLRAVSLMSSRDYAGRFLLELLQNGHDAHPADRTDGRVHVLLDETEGPHGTLYVANGGRPFGWQQVERICKLAQSDKRVGDGIGNKGLGFRSVLEVVESPEIYSDGPDGPGSGSGGGGLDGYRFRFATPEDLRVLLGDDALAERAVKEFPPLQLPFPADELPPICSELSALGHVTVVRLALRSDIARQAAVRRLKELAGARTPVMLFLRRLGGLVLEHRTADGSTDRVDLVREERPAAMDRPEVPGAGERPSVPVVSVVRVDLGAAGEFLVARGTLPGHRLRATLDEAVAEGSLDESWLDWREVAEVEAALPTGAEASQRGQLYTFLPLGGDVAAPLRGHVNAPFFTKMDRTDLDREHPLNAMLFDALAETCLLAAERWRSLPGAGHRAAAVDVVAWETGARAGGLLAAAAERVHGCAFAEVPLVPVLEEGAAAWTTPQRAVLWPTGEFAALSAEAAGAAGIPVADPSVGGGRLRRLARVCTSLRCSLEPTSTERAEYVERIVELLPLPGPGEPVGNWDGVYSDLAVLFGADGWSLRGRKLLLTDDGKLGRCNGGGEPGPVEKSKARREAFFQPAQRDTALVVPDVLRRRLFHLHDGLACAGAGGGRDPIARHFLETHGLVKQFDVQQLLGHVRKALAASSSQKLRDQALKFVFRLHRSHRSGRPLDVSGLGLYLPSAAGPMIRAAGAAFGAGWQGTCGDDLAAVVEEGRSVSPSLKWLVDRLIAPPEEFVGRKESQEEWRDFLVALGVTDGLIPVSSGGALERGQGNQLRTSWLVQAARVGPRVADQWTPFVQRPSSTACYPQTPYVGTAALRLPGQDVVGELSEAGRLAYARLVLQGLSHWGERKFTSRWTRDRSGDADSQLVLTPLAAFVREQPWLPVRGRERHTVFVRPREAWHYQGPPEEEPAFLQSVALRFRGLLDAGNTLARLRELGLPTWDRAEDSLRLIADLGRQVASGAVGAEDWPTVQRANQRAWRALVSLPEGDRAPILVAGRLTGAELLVESGERLTTADFQGLRKGGRTLYVTGDRDSLTARLLRETEHHLLVVPGVAGQVFGLLRSILPGAVRLVDRTRPSVVVDETTDDLTGLGVPVTGTLPWLPLAVAALADHADGGIRPPDTALTALVAAVRALRVHGYRSLALSIGELPIDLPEHLSGVLPVPDPRRPLVLVPKALLQQPDWEASGPLLEAAAHAVGRPAFGIRLRLAAYELQAVYADSADPGEDRLARALQLSPAQVQETKQRLDGSVAGILERCLPVLVHCLGEERARDLVDPPPSDSREFVALLVPHQGELPLAPAKLVAEARAARDVDELRRAAGIDFAEFNRTLAELAPRYRPTSRAEEHEDEVRRYVDLHRGGLVDRLRWARVDRFDRREAVGGWPGLRSLSWITAPGAWALTVDQVSPAGLRAHIESELTRQLGHEAPAKGERLPALESLRGRNGVLVRRTAPRIVSLIRAAGRPVPGALDGEDPEESLLSLLDGAGALDFRELAEADVTAWAAALGQWPAGMPVELDPAAHGLTQEDLERVQDAEWKEREARVRRRGVISLGGTEFDIAAGDFTELVVELETLLEVEPGRLRGGNRFADLKEPKAPRAARTGSARAGGRPPADRNLSAAQRQAIGFVGEWFAYRWLRKHHPATNETSWVSSNGRSVFPGLPGDDGLGYDFRVGSGRHPLMFEVKATRGEGGEIELGTSEVAAAQRYAGSDRWRILVVTSVLDPDAVRVRVLPNPFGPRGRGRYREEGGALRFSYRV